MNQPPSGDGDDDMDRRFQTGLKDDGGPSEAVRRAILDHAGRMAVEHGQSRPGGRTPAMLTARRRNTIFGALAAAVFAGLLVVPILRTPVVRRQSPVAPQSAQAPRLAEREPNNTTYSGAGAQRRLTADADKPKEAAGPAASKTEPQSVLGAAPSPGAPAASADARASAS